MYVLCVFVWYICVCVCGVYVCFVCVCFSVSSCFLVWCKVRTLTSVIIVIGSEMFDFLVYKNLN